MLELSEGKLVSLDEHRLLERLYPSIGAGIGAKKITSWRKQRYTADGGIQYTRYIGEFDWRCEEILIVDVKRSG